MGAVLGKCGRGFSKRKHHELSTDLFNEGVSAEHVRLKVPRHASVQDQLPHPGKPTPTSHEADNAYCFLDESTLVVDARAHVILNDSTLIGGDRTATHDALDGSTLPDPEPVRWQKGEMIGSGAFGRVYMGMNLASGELLAVKQVSLPKEGAQGYAKAREHIRGLQAEVAVLRQLRHPNIVRYMGTERTDSALNIFLEFVPGGSIASLLSKFGSFTEQVVGMYTRQILEGLEYLHRHRIMHRDIKGANILVDKSGGVKLADFGASKRVHELATISEVTKSIQGTPYWMAPEVIKQTGHGRPADIWSVGCTVIEMATGKPPWSQFQSQLSALFHIASSAAPPDIPASLSKDAQDFVLQCLQRQPSLRPTASQLLEHPFMRRFVQFSRTQHANADCSLSISFDAIPGREQSFVEHSLVGKGDPLGRDAANNALCQVDEANEPLADLCCSSLGGSTDGLHLPRGTDSASTGLGSLLGSQPGTLMLFSQGVGSLLGPDDGGIDEDVLLGPLQPCWDPTSAPTATQDEILQYLSLKVEEDEKRLLAPLVSLEHGIRDGGCDASARSSRARPKERSGAARAPREVVVVAGSARPPELMGSLEADQSLLSLSRACTDDTQHEDEALNRAPSEGRAAAGWGPSEPSPGAAQGGLEESKSDSRRYIDIRAEPGPAWLVEASTASVGGSGGERASAHDLSRASPASRSGDASRQSSGRRREVLASHSHNGDAGVGGRPTLLGSGRRADEGRENGGAGARGKGVAGSAQGADPRRAPFGALPPTSVLAPPSGLAKPLHPGSTSPAPKDDRHRQEKQWEDDLRKELALQRANKGVQPLLR